MLMCPSFLKKKKKILDKSILLYKIIVQLTYIFLLYVFDGEPVPRRSKRSRESVFYKSTPTKSCIAIDLYL
jgi:hypothetical protein